MCSISSCISFLLPLFLYISFFYSVYISFLFDINLYVSQLCTLFPHFSLSASTLSVSQLPTTFLFFPVSTLRLFLFLSALYVSLSVSLFFSASSPFPSESPLGRGNVSQKLLIIIRLKYFKSRQTSKALHSHVLRFPNRRERAKFK